MLKGFALGWIVSDDGRAVLFGKDDLAALIEAKAAIVRFEFRLGAHPAWDAQILARYREAVAPLHHAGIAIVGLLGNDIVAHGGQADWNANHAAPGASNPFIGRYVAAVRAVVAAFPEISLWEVWNEPNCWTVTPTPTPATPHNGTFIYPSLYAALLCQAAAAIHAARPAATAIVGGILAHGVDPMSSGLGYLRDVYAALPGQKLPCGGVGLHLYLDGAHAQTVLGELGGLLQAHGEAHQIFVTEAGWQSPPLAGHEQAARLQALFRVCRQAPGVAATCWFELRDNQAATPPLRFGVCQAGWARKEAFAAFRDFA